MIQVDNNRLTMEEQVKCVKQYQNTHDEKYTSQMLQSNLGFIIQLVDGFYIGDKLNRDDLISVACLGMFKAMDTYDESYNVSFLSYAVWHMKSAIYKEINRYKSVVRVPQYLKVGSVDVSFHSTIQGTDNKTLEDVIGDDEDILENLDHRETIEYVLKKFDDLTEKEKYIIEHRYGLNKCKVQTLEEIGNVFNISKERIRQIENNTLRKLKRIMTNEGESL